MSAGRKQLSHCNLLDYIEENDPDLHAAVRNCCAGYLFSLKGKAGITFLMPEKKNPVHKEIVDGSYGDIDEKTAATDKLSALVIYDKLETLEDIKAKADDLPNALRKKVEIDLAKSSANDVKLKSGGVIKPDKNFKDASRRRVQSVFVLSGAGVPVDGPDAEFKYVKTRNGQNPRRKKQEKVEGGEDEEEERRASKGEVEAERQLRMTITTNVENAYIAVAASGEMGRWEIPAKAIGGARQPAKLDMAKRNPYLESTMSLINYILMTCSDETVEKVLVGRVLPLISYENIDFYLLVEPHNSSGNYLIPTDIIRGWYDSQPSVNVKKVFSQIDELMDKRKGAALYEKRFAVWEAVDDEREGIEKNRRSVSHIRGVYKRLVDSNKVGKIENVLPKELHNFYKSQPDRKLLEDELRYYAARVFATLDRQFNRDAYNSLINNIANLTSSSSSAQDLRVLNENALRYGIDPKEKLEEIASFVNSQYFMFGAMSEAVHEKIVGEFNTSSRPSGEGDTVWMPDARAVVKKYKAGAIKMGGVDDKVKNQLLERLTKGMTKEQLQAFVDSRQ